jgi:hypothetical protein
MPKRAALRTCLMNVCGYEKNDIARVRLQLKNKVRRKQLQCKNNCKLLTLMSL